MLRELAHLEEQLGSERFRALIDSANTGKVKAFCDNELLSLPTEMTVGGRTYDILSFLEGDETSVKGDVMVARAKNMDAHQGKDECEHLRANQADIPVALRGKVVFVFTDYRRTDDSGDVYYVYWNGDCWVQGWYWHDDDWSGNDRVLRRKSA